MSDRTSRYIRVGGYQDNRFERRLLYPYPLLDISRYELPTNLQDVFELAGWLYDFTTYLSTIFMNMASYPITDMRFDVGQGKDDELNEKTWKLIFMEYLDILNHMIEAGLDLYVFGNTLRSLYTPKVRKYTCMSCGFMGDFILLSDVRVTTEKSKKDGLKWTGRCIKCGKKTEVHVEDMKVLNHSKMNIIKWPVTRMSVKHNPISGSRFYYYEPVSELEAAIKGGDVDLLSEIEFGIIKSVRNGTKFKLDPARIFHMRLPGRTRTDDGLAWPITTHSFKNIGYLMTLRRAQEAIAAEHIIPFDILYPAETGGESVLEKMNAGSFVANVQQLFEKRNFDINYRGISPIPIGKVRIGGDGKLMLVSPEIEQAIREIVASFGMPYEIVYGNMTYSGANVALRMTENKMIRHRTGLVSFLEFIKKEVRIYDYSLPDCKISMSDFKMADDQQKRSLILQLKQMQLLSDDSTLEDFGYSYDEQLKKLKTEAKDKESLAVLNAVVQTLAHLKSQESLDNYTKSKLFRQQLQGYTQILQSQVSNDISAQTSMIDHQTESEYAQELARLKNPNLSEGIPVGHVDMGKTSQHFYDRLSQMPQDSAAAVLQDMRGSMPEIYKSVSELIQAQGGLGKIPRGSPIDMRPLPEKLPPRRTNSPI